MTTQENPPIIADANIAGLFQQYIDAAADLGRAEGSTRERRMLETGVRRAWNLLDSETRISFYESDNIQEMLENNLSEGSFVPDELENLIAAAEQHGEDEDPDHTCGDLQDYLRLLVARLDAMEIRTFFKDDTIVALTQQGLNAASAPKRDW